MDAGRNDNTIIFFEFPQREKKKTILRTENGYRRPIKII